MRKQSWLQRRNPNPDVGETVSVFHKHPNGKQKEVEIRYYTHHNKSRPGRKIRQQTPRMLGV